ncbi:MAG: hypothetical protein ACOYMW_02320 [Candidatus Competibacteraceae bacterium]
MGGKWSSDDAKTIREMIWKEGDLINHRMTWLCTLQGLLFTALGFSWKNSSELVIPLAITGIVVSAASLFGLWLARQAVVKLKEDWEKSKPESYSGPDVIGYFLDPRLAFLLPWFVLPVLFSGAWIYFLVIRTG